MKRLVFVLLIIVFGFAGLHGQAAAADEVTPANEGVCDELIGGTPGLYGLCVAFCEAQDCEATFDAASGTVTFASTCNPSKPKLLENYNRRRNAEDPAMPCVNVLEHGCPCWTEDELAAIAEGELIQCGEVIAGYNLAAYDWRNLIVGASVFFNESNGGECYYRTMTPQLLIRNLLVTPTEARNCAASIQAQCTNLGF